jgi:lipoprotein-anchoring transpeptidase ErfK/SrfK
MRRRLLVLTGIVLALAAVALTAGGAYAYFWEQGRSDMLAAGVTVAGIDVGGLQASQASVVLEQRVANRLERPLRITAGARTFVIRPPVRVNVAAIVSHALKASRNGGIAHRFFRDIAGRRVHVAIPVQATVSHPELARIAVGIASVVDEPARSARVVASATALRVIPGHAGRAVDIASLLGRLEHALADPSVPRTVAVPTHVVEPRWTMANLARRYPAFILVDRESFSLRLYRHLKLAKTYPIAVGQAGLETPAGLYHINDKQIDPSWHVPNSAWAGSLAGRVIPPGPSDPIKARWMGFWNGAGIHGTDETWSIGHAVSHGCVRMTIADVEQLYPLVPLGTPVYVG